MREWRKLSRLRYHLAHISQLVQLSLEYIDFGCTAALADAWTWMIFTGACT